MRTPRSSRSFRAVSGLASHLPAIPRAHALTPEQIEKLETYGAYLLRFNRGLNLVSRETENEVIPVHIPHTLALGARGFPAGATVVDWGTGGGLPAIPLAIMFPDVRFCAIDSVEKKIMAVKAMARRLGLANVEARAVHAEAWKGRAAFSVSRATARLSVLWRWHSRRAVAMEFPDDAWRPGLLCLKGGDLHEETAELQEEASAEGDAPAVEVIPLAPWYEHPYFETKALVHVYRRTD